MSREGDCDVPSPESKGENVVDILEALWLFRLMEKLTIGESRGHGVRRDLRDVRPSHPLD